MFEPMYLVQGTHAMAALVFAIPAEIGIVKLDGCHWFAPATKDRDGNYGGGVGWRSVKRYSLASDGDIAKCKEKYGDIPGVGEAWLVEETKIEIKWTRVDHNLALLFPSGRYAKKDHSA